MCFLSLLVCGVCLGVVIGDMSCWLKSFDARRRTHSRCRETGPLKLAALSAEETELMDAMQKRLDTLARRASDLGTSVRLSLCFVGCVVVVGGRKRVGRSFVRLIDAYTYAINPTIPSKGVRLMIDAEQTYFQEAIDNIVADMQRRHNMGTYPVVYTTYQVGTCVRVLCVCVRESQ